MFVAGNPKKYSPKLRQERNTPDDSFMIAPPEFTTLDQAVSFCGDGILDNKGSRNCWRFFRTADFQVCRIAGFPTRRPFANLALPLHEPARRWVIGWIVGLSAIASAAAD
jgi:hypothetical protein